MLILHLESSNKFLVGCKKQELKYDGQRITIQSGNNLSNGSSAMNQTVQHGHGVLYYSNGLIYDGEFSQNKRHGFGILKFNHV